MTLYVTISNGLRGCYMPDSCYVAKFTTRCELKAFIANECSDMREAYGHGGTKQEISAIAAYAWKMRRNGWQYDLAIGFGRSRAANDRPFGLFLGHATRREYSEFLKSESEF